MESRSFLHKVFLLVVIVTALFTLTACEKEAQQEEEATEVVLQPSSTPIPTETPAKEQTQETNYASTTEYISTTNLFSLEVPHGWSSEEVLPGAVFVMANSEAALEHYKDSNALQSGDFVTNIGFLPLALLQENQLKHLNFKFEASPEVFLQSLLPMFRIGDELAGNIAGEATLVSLSNEREAGLLTLSGEGREGMIMMFEAGDGVLAFVSVEAFPGEMADYQAFTHALAAEVVYLGAQDVLYAVLRGQ